MSHKDLLKEMSDSVGVQEPVHYFGLLTKVLGLLFDRLDRVEKEVQLVKTYTALAIEWDPRVAANMLAEQIKKMKSHVDRDIYLVEIAALQLAYADDVITQEYTSFCQFWQDTLGYHPFLDY
jgi:hypothetical protein